MDSPFRLRDLSRALVLAAAAAGAAGWIDAIRLGAAARPPLDASEWGALAAKGASLLVGPILLTLLLAAAWSAVRRRGFDGGRLAARHLAGWGAALAVLILSGFSVKVGWLAGALLAGLLAARATGRLLGPAAAPAPWARPPGRLSAAAVAAAILWAAMFLLPLAAGGGAGAGAGQGPAILLVVIDALRADHLGAWGYGRATSPNLDRLAAAGVRFEKAAAPSSWTLPAMASVFTSALPGQTGVADRGDALPEEAPELAGRLKAAGYSTVAISTNPWLKRAFGFDDGFDLFYDVDRLTLERHLAGVRLKNLALRRAGRIRLDPEQVPAAPEVTRRALLAARRLAGGPFFLYVHYMDVHAPYAPPPAYRGAFGCEHRFDLPDLFLESRFRNGKHRGDAAVLDHMVELYDEEILATDASIGRLAAGLREAGLDATTTLIVTADHGEEFYEHGGTTHGHTLYEEVLHVPLIVVPPGRLAAEGGGRVVGERVSTLDIYPTLLDLAGAPIPAGLEGRSLRARIEGTEDGPLEPRVLGAQLFKDGRPWTALYAGPDKLIRARPSAADPSSAAILELYHLDRDPGERADAAAAEPERAVGLAAALDGLEKIWGLAGIGGRRGEAIDEETLRQLKALGYVN